MIVVGQDAFENMSDGDMILHLLPMHASDQYINNDSKRRSGKIMNLLLRYLHLSPSALNALYNDMQMPLYIATFFSKFECVVALLRCHYINVNIKRSGFTPLKIATTLIQDQTRLVQNHSKVKL